MSYRDEQSFREEYLGERFHKIRSMISRREIDPTQSDGDHVLALGRQAEDGSFEQDDMDVLGSCGIIARPADDSVVETITLFVGGDANHPVAVGQLDHTRRYVIADVKLDADETIVYTSKTIVKILKDGTVEIRNVDGTAVPLATKADVDALTQAVNAMVDVFNAGQTAANGSSGAWTSNVPMVKAPAATGTQVLKAQ